MKKTKWSLLLVLGLVLSMFLAACGGGDEGADDNQTDDNTSEEQKDNNTDNEGNNNEGETGGDEEKILRITESAEIPTMDPSLATDTVALNFINATYEGLYRVAPGGDLVSGVAKKDETEVSEDGLIWTFHLREDAKWSNGEPVTAHDFVYSWQRIIDPETKSQYGPYFFGGLVKNATEISATDDDGNPLYPDMYGKVEELGVKALDDYTLQVELINPAPYFGSFAAFPVFVPLNKDFVEAQGENFALEVENMLFNGPYVMTEWKHEESWTLVKNENYWDKANVGLDGIEVSVVKDRATAVNLFETGEIDRVGISGDFIDKYKTSPFFSTELEPVVFYLQFNRLSAEKADLMNNKNFRLALAQGFNKQDFIDVVYGNSSVPADGLVPADFVKHPETGEDWRDINGNLLTSDIEAGQEAWAKAKEELGFDEVTISFISGDTETGKLITEFFKNEWEKNLPGLTLELKNVPFKERLRLQREQLFEVVFSGWGPDFLDPMTFMDLFVTDGSYNDGAYSNDQVDDLITKAKTEYATDPNKRWEAMLEAEKIMMDEVAIGPVFQRARSFLTQPYVKNMKLNPFGPDYSFKYITIEK